MPQRQTLRQRERQYARSPYLSAPKSKDSTFFPKIHKGEPYDRNEYISKSSRKKNYNEEIFKAKDSNFQAQRTTTGLNPQIKTLEQIYTSKQYRQLQQEIEEMARQHQLEIKQIQMKKDHINTRLKVQQANSYNNKYTLWELKNQIMELETIIRQEQSQNQRYENAMMGMQEGEQQEQNDEYQDENSNENDEEVKH